MRDLLNGASLAERDLPIVAKRINAQHRPEQGGEGGCDYTGGYPANTKVVSAATHSGETKAGYHTVSPGDSYAHGAPSPNKGKA